MKPFLLALGFMIFGASTLVSALAQGFPSPRLSVENLEEILTLEYKRGSWVFSRQNKKQSQVTSKKFSTPAQAALAQQAFDNARSWFFETSKHLHPETGCQDMRIELRGSWSNKKELCSASVGHRAATANLRAQLLSLSK